MKCHVREDMALFYSWLSSLGAASAMIKNPGLCCLFDFLAVII